MIPCCTEDKSCRLRDPTYGPPILPWEVYLKAKRTCVMALGCAHCTKLRRGKVTALFIATTPFLVRVIATTESTWAQ